jgi:hypothetical protein
MQTHCAASVAEILVMNEWILLHDCTKKKLFHWTPCAGLRGGRGDYYTQLSMTERGIYWNPKISCVLWYVTNAPSILPMRS